MPININGKQSAKKLSLTACMSTWAIPLTHSALGCIKSVHTKNKMTKINRIIVSFLRISGAAAQRHFPKPRSHIPLTYLIDPIPVMEGSLRAARQSIQFIPIRSRSSRAAHDTDSRSTRNGTQFPSDIFIYFI